MHFSVSSLSALRLHNNNVGATERGTCFNCPLIIDVIETILL